MASGCVPGMEEGGQDQDGRSRKSSFIADIPLRVVYRMRD